eukprot:482491-Prymnesium_polylepis.2
MPTCACNVTNAPLAVRCAPGASITSRSCAYPDLGLQFDRLVVFEPCAVRNQLDVSAQLSRPFSEYPNLVYAPHTYTDSFTLWKSEPYWVALATATREANAMRAALLVTEWGGADISKVRNISLQQQQHIANGMHWVWKQNGGGGWSLHDAADGQNFTIRMDRLHAASAVRPRAVAGELLEYSAGVRADNLTFYLRARCGVTAVAELLTEVYFPPHAASCANQTRVRGAAALQQIVFDSADGSATALVTCSSNASGGEFEVVSC